MMSAMKFRHGLSWLGKPLGDKMRNGMDAGHGVTDWLKGNR
jgi:hypothetical protein